MDEVVVGIAVAQDELVVMIQPAGSLSRWTNDAAGHAALVAMLRPLAPRRIVLEGTGGLEQPVVAVLADAELPTVVANPAQVRSFARGIGRHAKTDPVDATVLAQFAAQVQPPVRPHADAAAREVRGLVVVRRQLRDLRVRAVQQRGRAHPIAHPAIDRVVASLTTELHDLDAAIAQHLTLDPTWRAKHTILRRVPGIGPVIAATVIAELPELGTIDSKAIASLVGVAPRTKQSGRTTRPATIGGGRASVRAALSLATVTAIRHNPVIRAFYDRLLAAHQPRKVALIAAERKLLGMLTAMLRDGALWQPTAPAHPITP
jgi:transposase